MKVIQNSTAGGESSVSENLSMEGLINHLMPGQPQEEETEVLETETEEEETEVLEVVETETDDLSEDVQEEETEAETADNEIDLLSLTPEQFQAAAKKYKSRLLERVGELTAKNKALQAQAEEAGTKQQSVKTIPTEQNPFGQLKTVEEIQEKFEAFESTLETTDRLLEEYEDYGNDDIIEVGSQQFTKKQVKLANRNARDAIAKYLPAQAAHLQTLNNYKVANEQWQELAKQEVPEIADEKSEVGKAYKQLVNDPLVKELKEKLPHLGIQIEYLLAHTAKSKFGKVAKVTTGAGTKLKVKPPASPVGAGASRQGQSQSSKYTDMMKRFEESGSADDWVAAQKYK
jgi:hypothetical protein